MSVFALIVNHFDVVQVGVSPVHQSVNQVQSDTVREDDFTVHKLCTVLTVHVAALHPWCRPIVCEEHFTVAEGQKGEDGKLELNWQEEIIELQNLNDCPLT